jgi:hypothetical protein
MSDYSALVDNLKLGALTVSSLTSAQEDGTDLVVITFVTAIKSLRVVRMMAL